MQIPAHVQVSACSRADRSVTGSHGEGRAFSIIFNPLHLDNILKRLLCGWHIPTSLLEQADQQRSKRATASIELN